MDELKSLEPYEVILACPDKSCPVYIASQVERVIAEKDKRIAELESQLQQEQKEG